MVAGQEDADVTDEQSRAPYLERWLAYLDEGVVPFSTPGHKQGRGAPPEFREAFGPCALALDIPHDGGTYETHLAVDPLDEAERLAAALWGARDAVFLVNGSTTGNLAVLLTLGRPGRPIVVTRAMHKSLLAGLVLSGAQPVYVVPELHTESGLLLDVAPEAVERALQQHPGATAVAIVSPTYMGVTSAIGRLAAVARTYRVPLFVDEAWGPHLGFHPALPPAAIRSGADVAVTSLHKLAGALTQTALLLVGSDAVDAARLRAAVAMVQTTSPAAFLYASLDATRRRLALDGERLLARTLALAEKARHALASIPGLHVIGPEIVAGRPGAGFDPTRLVVDVQGVGLTGLEAKRRLRRDYGIAAEMADLVSVVCLLTVGDTPETIEALVRAFTALAADARSQGSRPHADRNALTALLRATGPIVAGAPQVLTPREAFFAPAERVPLACAAGRVAAEPITPYPPGIPVVAPGEAIRPEVVEFLRAGIAAGMRFNGASDPMLETIRVVRD
jgi:lysine decarboxylase